MAAEYHLPSDPRPMDVVRFTNAFIDNSHELLVQPNGQRIDWDRVARAVGEVDMSAEVLEADKLREDIARHDLLVRARRFFGRKAVSTTKEPIPMRGPEVEPNPNAITQPIHRFSGELNLDELDQ